MTNEIRPMTFRKHGRALALTIPAEYVHEIGLVAGDIAFPKREPDGLRLRIIRHSQLVELATETENPTGGKPPVEAAPTAPYGAVEQEETVDAEVNDPECGKLRVG